MDHNGSKPASIRLLQFKVPGLPDLALAVTLQEVLEVIEPGPVVGLPFAPPFVTGLSRWRNRVVTVIDMADILSKDAHRRPFRETGAHYLVAQVTVDDQLDAIAWPIISGASMLNAPSLAPQVNLSTSLLPQAIYATFSASDVPFALLNLAGISKYITQQ
jgi:chemotaxis signal transduction protein